MSGGHFNYADGNLKSEMFGWVDKPYDVMEDAEISELVWDLLDLIHKYDYYVSGDTLRKNYLEAKDDFKKKWFGDREVRLEDILERKIEDLRKEMKEMVSNI